MEAKLIGTKGKLADREFPIDARGLALAAPGGKRVEIKQTKAGDPYHLNSPGYPVTVNGEETETIELTNGDLINIGGNEFRFDGPQPAGGEIPEPEPIPPADKIDVKETEKGLPPIDDELDDLEDSFDVTDTVQVSRVDFCEGCGVPVTDKDFRTKQAHKVGLKVFCSECFENKFKKEEKAGKPAASARGSSASGRRQGVKAGTEPIDQDEPRSSRASGRRGSAKRSAVKSKRGKAVRKPDSKPGTEPIEQDESRSRTSGRRTSSKRSAKKSKREKSVPKPATEAIEPDETTARKSETKKKRTAIKKKAVKKDGTDAIEPAAAAEPRASRRGKSKGKGTSKTKGTHKHKAERKETPAEPRSSRRSKTPVAKEGPGAAAKILTGIGNSVLMLFKGIGMIFVLIGRSLKRRSIRAKIRKELQGLGQMVCDNSANVIFAPDDVLEKAAALKAARITKPDDDENNELLSKELGSIIYEEYFEDPSGSPLFKGIRNVSAFEITLSKVGKKPGNEPEDEE